MKIRLVTVVWGDDFIDLFLKITARTLLAAGNLPALSAAHDVAYVLYTTEQGAARLRGSRLFGRIEATCAVEIDVIPPSEVASNDLAIHWEFWRRAAERAKRNGEALFFVIPDMLFADGTLVRWAELFEQGYRAVWTSVPQVALETTLAEIDSRFGEDSEVAVSVADVHDLQIRHMHPLMASMFRDGRRWIRHPEMVFCAVPGEGLAQRQISSHLFCIDPGHFETTNVLSPVNRLDAIAFDECRGTCLERMLKHADLSYRPVPLDEVRLGNRGMWMDWFCSPADIVASHRTYRFSPRAAPPGPEFRRAAARLGFFACQNRLTGAIYRVIRAVREVGGCRRAAQIGAAAHYAGRLRRRWRIDGPVTVFAPQDARIDALGADWLTTLLRPGREKALADAVLAHVFPGRLTLTLGDRMTAAGPGAQSVATIVAGPIELDSCTIYVVDRPLLTAEQLAALESRPSLLPNRWSSHPDRLTDGALAPRRVAPAENGGSSVVRRALSHRFGRRILRTGYRAASSVPSLRPIAERAVGVYQDVRRKRLFASEREAAEQHDASIEVSAEQRSTLRDLQAARILLNLAEILRLYRSKLDDPASPLPPLALVEDCVRRAALDSDRLLSELQRLVADAPQFAEAWLDLADAHVERGETDAALGCYERCLAARPQLAIPGDRTVCTPIAAFGKATILEMKGLLSQAADAYARGIAYDKRLTMMRVAYGDLLRRLDRPMEALVEFEFGMETDFSALGLSPIPSDFTELANRVVARFGCPSRDKHESGAPLTPAYR